MVKMINKTTGSVMYVAEGRVEEYKAAGHKLVAEPVVEETKPAAKKKTTKR